MHHILGRDRNQTLLLPDSVNYYISPDNPVRFVDAFVEQLICKELAFVELSPKRPADQKLTDYLERLDRCDVQEAEPSAASPERLAGRRALDPARAPKGG